MVTGKYTDTPEVINSTLHSMLQAIAYDNSQILNQSTQVRL